MAYNPGVSFFIQFYELNPSEQNQCIFFTQKGARCRWRCQEIDNKTAVRLHKDIIRTSSEAVTLDLLKEYVLSNCCRSGRAQHRDRIVDIDLLEPLAQRWQDEIRRQSADRSSHAPNTTHTTTIYPLNDSPFCSRETTQIPSNIITAPLNPVSTSTPLQMGTPRSPSNSVFTSQPSESQPRYGLRPREVNTSANFISTRSMSISRVPLSEFRPHKAEPLSSDSVSHKILDPLQDRDFQTGSLYIFDRGSSPGHVKIGWTAVSVPRRLEDWSKCGYSPNLLFTVHYVPYAQRVETLTHHELIKEWRRERMCKAPSCRKSHQEWFEITRERAAQVLGDWAYFMRKAEPYDSRGFLKTQWRAIIKAMDGDNEMVTAKRLLERYDAALIKASRFINGPVELCPPLKIEDEAHLESGLKLERLEIPKEPELLVGSQRSERTKLPKETPVLDEAWLKQTALTEILLRKADKQFQSNLALQKNPLPETEPLCKIEPLPSSQFVSRADPPFTTDPLPKSGPLTKLESLFDAEPLPTSETAREEVLVPDSRIVEKLSPEQIPLPPSPLLESTTFPEEKLSSQDTLSPQETKPNPKTTLEIADTIHTSTSSDSDVRIVDASSNSTINSRTSA